MGPVETRSFTEEIRPASFFAQHVQVNYSRSSTGRVTCKTVYLDGVKSTLNVTELNVRALGWSRALITNFQSGWAWDKWVVHCVPGFSDHLSLVKQKDKHSVKQLIVRTGPIAQWRSSIQPQDEPGWLAIP